MAAAICNQCQKPIMFADYDPDCNLVRNLNGDETIVCNGCLGTPPPSILSPIRVVAQELCAIGMVIDRSGSMVNAADGVIEGFNTFITQQQKVAGKALVQIVQFDHEYEVLHNWVDIREVPLMRKFEPRGNTALLDAIGNTVIEMDRHIRDMAVRPAKMVFAVITDGFENASKEFTHPAIRALLDNRRAAGWQVVFILGMPQDRADLHQHMYGGARGQTVSHANSSYSNRVSYQTLSASTRLYRTGETKSVVITPEVAQQMLDDDAEAKKKK